MRLRMVALILLADCPRALPKATGITKVARTRTCADKAAHLTLRSLVTLAQVQWDGGSIFGGRGSPTVPGSGFLNNQSSLPTLGGGHSDYGADLALHSGNFRNTIQGMGYNNLNQFLNQTGFRLPGQVGGGQGIGGGSRPMTQNFSGGGVAQGEDQTTPEQMAEVYAMIMRDNEQKRREAMNESPARRNDIEPMFSDLEQQIAAQPEGKTSISFAGGGRVPFLPKQQQISGYGTDSVPAALTPGEIVLNKQQQGAVMPRPGMKSRLKPAELAAIEIAMRKKQGGLPSARPLTPTI